MAQKNVDPAFSVVTTGTAAGGRPEAHHITETAAEQAILTRQGLDEFEFGLLSLYRDKLSNAISSAPGAESLTGFRTYLVRGSLSITGEPSIPISASHLCCSVTQLVRILQGRAYSFKGISRPVPPAAAELWDAMVEEDCSWLHSYLTDAPSERYSGNRAG
jgi:hypothetical protein